MDMDYVTGPERGGAVWWGHLDESLMALDWVSIGHRLADAAEAGNWSAVFRTLDRNPESGHINRWRPGGTSWFTVLHHAAWQAAPITVISELVERGAWRSLRDSRGRTAYQVAEEVGLKKAQRSAAGQEPYYFGLNRVLRPFAAAPAPSNDPLESQLGALIIKWLRRWQGDRDLVSGFRLPPLEIIDEIPTHRLWFPVRSPGLRAGFYIARRRGYFEVETHFGDGATLRHVYVVTAENSIRVYG